MAARRCANPGCGRDITGRRAQATTCSTACRVRLHRQSKAALFEHEPLVIEQLRARRLTSEDALLWVLFPERMRAAAAASYRIEHEAVAA
jgi:hypothetical protein